MTKLLLNKGSLGCILVLLLVGIGFTQSPIKDNRDIDAVIDSMKNAWGIKEVPDPSKVIVNSRILNLDGAEAHRITFSERERFYYQFNIKNNLGYIISLKRLEFNKGFLDLVEPFESNVSYSKSNLGKNDEKSESEFRLYLPELPLLGDLELSVPTDVITDVIDFIMQNDKSMSYNFNPDSTLINPNKGLEIIIEFEGVKVGDERYTITPVFSVGEYSEFIVEPIIGRIIIEESTND